MNNMNENALLQEIEEDLARQRYEKLWKKWGPYIVGAGLLIVAATAGVTGYKSYKLEQAQKTTSAYVDMVLKSREAKDDLVGKFQAYGDENKGTALAAFARLKAADAALKLDKKDEAVKIYDELAVDKTVDTNYRQLADVLAVQTLLDSGDASALEARLQPLMKEDCIWRFTAKELAGYLAIRVGDKEKAKVIFGELKAMPGAPPSITARSGDVLAWLNEGA